VAHSGSDATAAEDEEHQGDDGQHNEDGVQHGPCSTPAGRIPNVDAAGNSRPSTGIRPQCVTELSRNVTSSARWMAQVDGPGSRRRTHGYARSPASTLGCGRMSTSGETITLNLPLTARHASTVRVVAASLAADCGFNIDEIDDLRLGINEAVSIMTDVDAPTQARLLVEFAVRHSTIAVVVTRTDVDGLDGAEPIDELARRILGVVVDSFEISDGSFLLSKSTTPTTPIT
jgi:hypothetical protein